MRQILKLLSRLYPPEWRSRYGEEYEALLEEAQPRVRDVFDVVWAAVKMWLTSRSFVRIVLPCALAGALVATGISFARPAMYRSQTLIAVETDHLVSIDNELAQQVRGVLMRPFLEELIQKDNLYPRERVRMPMSDVINLMRRDIWLRPIKEGDDKPMTFTLEFSYPDAHMAQRVDEELTSRLMAANLQVGNASEATNFLQEQLVLVKNSTTQAHIQSDLQRAEAAVSQMPTFRVLKAASLPKTLEGLGGAGFGMIGALGGLIAGLITAAVLGSHQRAIN